MGAVNAQDVLTLAGVSPGQTADLLKMPGNSQIDTSTDSFASVLHKTTQFSVSVSVNTSERSIANLDVDKTSADKLQNVQKDNEAAKTDEDVKTDKTDQNNLKADNKSKETENTKSDPKKDAAVDKAEKAGKDLIKDVSEKLEISEEEVVNAMEVLGISAIDLLQPENMADLVNLIVEQSEDLQIIDNGGLFNAIDELMEDSSNAMQDILDELGVTQEEFDGLLTEAVKNRNPQQEIMTFADQTKEDNATIIDPMQDKQNIEIKKPEFEDHEDHGSGHDEKRKAEYFGKVSTTAVKDTIDMLQDHDMSVNSFWNQLMDKVNDSIANTSQIQENSLHTSARDIIDQVTEFIKVSVETDMTKMELRLHPESLGNINIMLASTKDGNMVAQFTTQNETVRDALLSQIAQLQKQFNEQGLKVTEISVSVETHAFEQNLEQNEHRSGEEEAQSKKTRRINLGDLSLEIDDEMDDADKLVAEMMAANGNTIDYTA